VDVQRIKDLFVYLARESGGEINAEARGQDLGADPRSIREWNRRLTETLLVIPLERFTEHAAAGLRARPKIYAADPGIVQAFAALPAQDAEVRARAFEAAVFRHLREVARGSGGELSYFRHKDDLEIDFVLHVAGRKIGIEVTSGARVRPDKVERLRRAGGGLGADLLFLIHGGVVQEVVQGARTISLPRFLLDPAAVLET
jgi:predicted AAA+ superfamily ATPase